MRKPTYPVTIDTLGALIDHDMRAFLACSACLKAGRPHVREIDLEQWAQHVGRDRMFINARWPVRCATCGNQDVQVRITPAAPSHPTSRPSSVG